MASSKITKPSAPQTFPTVQTEDGLMVDAFGQLWPLQSDIAIHLNCYRMGLTKEEGGMGPARHFYEAYIRLWPHRAIGVNEWFIKRIKTFVESPAKNERIITLAGGSGIAKSADAAYYAIMWYWADPTRRGVIVGSTTLGSLKQRIWAYLTEAVSQCPYDMGMTVNSSQAPSMFVNKEDRRHRIIGVALKPGESEKTIADIIGFHPEGGVLVLIDEGTDVAAAILDIQTNLDESDKGKFYQMIICGNSCSRFDPHGRASEPADGWDSIDPDIDSEWPTKMGGRCLYFDCYRSPAVIGKEQFRANYNFLINEKKIRSEEIRLGKDSPAFWRFVRGFWPPEDATKTVLTLTMVARHGATSPAKWAGRWQIELAGLDPAFTSEGDECIMQFATLGMMENGLIGLEYGQTVSMKLDSRSTEPITYQIVRQARDICVARGVEPEFFGMDTWGFGAGAGDMLEKEWSPKIQKVVGIGLPSDEYIDSDMTQKAIDLYDRKITELWFAMRTFVQAGQIHGLEKMAVEEFCSRQYKWAGRKIVLESKRDYKKRMGREDNPTGSPDRADAAAIVLEVAKRHGFRPGGREIDSDERTHWQQKWEELRFGQTFEEREHMWENVGDISDSAMFGAGEDE